MLDNEDLLLVLFRVKLLIIFQSSLDLQVLMHYIMRLAFFNFVTDIKKEEIEWKKIKNPYFLALF